MRGTEAKRGGAWLPKNGGSRRSNLRLQLGDPVHVSALPSVSEASLVQVPPRAHVGQSRNLAVRRRSQSHGFSAKLSIA